jgi:hypothetical protein
VIVVQCCLFHLDDRTTAVTRGTLFMLGTQSLEETALAVSNKS